MKRILCVCARWGPSPSAVQRLSRRIWPFRVTRHLCLRRNLSILGPDLCWRNGGLAAIVPVPFAVGPIAGVDLECSGFFGGGQLG